MSRIEDDHQANRALERVALEKRQKEQQAKEKAQGDSAFSRLVAQSQTQKTRGEKVAQQSAHQTQQLHEEVRASHDSIIAEALQEARRGESADQAARAAGTFTHKLRQGKAAEERGALSGRAEDQSAASGRAASYSAQARGSEGTAQSRKADQAVTHERLEEKGSESPSGMGDAAGARPDKGELKAGRDSGKGGGQGQKDGKEEGAQVGFRLNPALMAPVPLAQPKADTGPSARLRALANEIAQKIVERVRVGTNAAGQAEFQIDLRSNVLAGLSIKISGGNGKIRALFSGNDRQVLKLLRDQSEGLKSALSGRGLTLEELKIEERA